MFLSNIFVQFQAANLMQMLPLFLQCPDGCSCHHDSSWSQNVIRCSERGLRAVPALIPMDATEVRLDGNAFAGGTLESQGSHLKVGTWIMSIGIWQP